MPLSPEIEKGLRNIKSITEKSVLEDYAKILQKEITEIEYELAEYRRLSLLEKRTPKDNIIFASLQEKYPTLTDLEFYLKRLNDYKNDIHSELTSGLIAPSLQSKSSKRALGENVSKIVKQYEVKIKKESVFIRKLELGESFKPVSEKKEKREVRESAMLFQHTMEHSVLGLSKGEKEPVRQGYMPTKEEIDEIRKIIKRMEATGQPIQKFRRTRGRTGAKYEKLTEIEKKLGLDYSVFVMPPARLIALSKTVLGEGSAGKVKIGQDLDTGELIAVKILKAKKGIERDPNYKERLKKEISISKEFGLVEGSTTRNSGTEEEKEYIVMPILQGHNLTYHFRVDPIQGVEPKAVEKGDIIEDLSEKLDIMISIAENLKELHEKNLIHRDLHGSNVMYDRTQKKTIIIDFGLSVKLQSGQEHFLDDLQLSCYLGKVDKDPDPITEKETAKKEQFVYNKTSDIWSLGGLFSDLITFDHTEKTKYVELVESLPEEVASELDSLIKEMQNTDPASSPLLTAEQVLERMKHIKLNYENSLKSVHKKPSI